LLIGRVPVEAKYRGAEARAGNIGKLAEISVKICQQQIIEADRKLNSPRRRQTGFGRTPRRRA
jgi:hypothetical protein